MEDQWCPQAAMKAYLTTLQLCKSNNGNTKTGCRKVMAEPECLEFISALAAGNGAKLIVEIASEMTPLTLALAVAARQTGGHLVCILPTQQEAQRCKSRVEHHYGDLKDVVKFVSGNPCEVMMGCRDVDFAVINGEFDEHLKLLEMMKKRGDGRGSVVVERLERGGEGGILFSEAVRGRNGIESVSMPVGGGMELTKIKSGPKVSKVTALGLGGRRRWRRFHVTVENM